MDTTFTFNSASASDEIKDAIDVRLAKVKALLTCLMSSTGSFYNKTNQDVSVVYNTLWTISDFVDEVNILWDYLE